MNQEEHPRMDSGGGRDPRPLLDGSWESHGRSPAAAAIIALLGIGMLYFNAESVLTVIAIGIRHMTSEAPEPAGDYFQRLSGYMNYYAGAIRIVLVISQYLFLLLPALWLIRRWHTRDVAQYIRLKRVPALQVVIAVLATVLLLPAANWVMSIVVERLNIPRELQEINVGIFSSTSPGEFCWLVIVVCITPAICEETFFRGYVQRTFERTISWKSVLVVGVIFGLFHFQPLGLLSLSMLGILFGYFYYRSGSILPGMAAHFTNNFISILLLYKPVQSAVEATPAALESIPFTAVAATLPIEAGLLLLYHRITRASAA